MRQNDKTIILISDTSPNNQREKDQLTTTAVFSCYEIHQLENGLYHSHREAKSIVLPRGYA